MASSSLRVGPGSTASAIREKGDFRCALTRHYCIAVHLHTLSRRGTCMNSKGMPSSDWHPFAHYFVPAGAAILWLVPKPRAMRVVRHQNCRVPLS